jgi:hypothetical protein
MANYYDIYTDRETNTVYLQVYRGETNTYHWYLMTPQGDASTANAFTVAPLKSTKVWRKPSASKTKKPRTGLRRWGGIITEQELPAACKDLTIRGLFQTAKSSLTIF